MDFSIQEKADGRLLGEAAQSNYKGYNKGRYGDFRHICTILHKNDNFNNIQYLLCLKIIGT